MAKTRAEQALELMQRQSMPQPQDVLLQELNQRASAYVSPFELWCYNNGDVNDAWLFFMSEWLVEVKSIYAKIMDGTIKHENDIQFKTSRPDPSDSLIQFLR